MVNLQQAFKSHEDWVPVMPPSDGFTDISVDRHEYQVAGNIFSPLKSFIQCFGGYWNAMADNPAGWSTHLEASCNYIANTAVRHDCLLSLYCQYGGKMNITPPYQQCIHNIKQVYIHNYIAHTAK